MNMYHMGFHLEAQRQQRTIDKKKAAENKTGPSQVSSSYIAAKQMAGNHCVVFLYNFLPLTKTACVNPAHRQISINKEPH